MAVSEAYACILEIVEAEFSHSGNLEHIYRLVDLEHAAREASKQRARDESLLHVLLKARTKQEKGRWREARAVIVQKLWL